MRNVRRLILILVAVLAAGSLPAADEGKFATVQDSQAEFDRTVRPLFVARCGKCHTGEKAEGKLDLLDLNRDMKASTSAARWAMVTDKVASREMPPQEGTPLKDHEVKLVTDWIAAEMKRAGKHLAKRAAVQNGNNVPHHLLFDPTQDAPFDAAPRIRTVSPEIYSAFTREFTKGSENLIGQPFSPGGAATFKDMVTAKVDEPVTAQLMGNAAAIVRRQTGFTVTDDGPQPLPGAQKEFVAYFDERLPLDEAAAGKLIKLQFQRVLKRDPTVDELQRFVAFLLKNSADVGRVAGIRGALSAVFLLPESVFRFELGGAAAETGRARLTPQEIAAALAFTLTDDRPPGWLVKAAGRGALDTQAGVADAVRKMLEDPKLAKPRILRFFREYFGYANALDVFKDGKDINFHDARTLVEDTDRLVEHILAEDRNVLRELLTTNKAFVMPNGAADAKKKRAEALAKFEAEKQVNPEKFKDKKPNLPGRAIYESYSLADFPDEQPVELPKEQRAGILTQPSWLVAWSTADDNHAILRGKWIRERLLGGVVPDLPITVDAQLPNAPQHTLRERMKVTQEQYCWQCHQYMNRLGLTLEMYDHLGRYRQGERVLDLEATAENVDGKGKPKGDVFKEVPVNAKGGFEFTLDAKLTGDVENAVDLVHRLADSEVVEQVFIRHAFRFWLGRNETLGDAATLRRAQAAYREGDGSFRALVISLLSSESFLDRISSTPPSPPRG